MALSANTVWEVRNGGNDTNGGGFVTGSSGNDYSQQVSPQWALSGIATSGAGAVFLTATAASTMVGNICNIVSGTNFTSGWYQITAVSVGVSVTVDRACCTGVGAIGVINIGGALVSAGAAAAQWVNGNLIYVKYNATPFSITSGSNNVAGGCLTLTGTQKLVGYDTTRTIVNTDANRPTFKASGISGVTVITPGGNQNIYVANIIVDGNSLASMIGFGGGQMVVNCKAANCTTTGFQGVQYAFLCEAASCGVGYNYSGAFFGCVAHNCTGAGFYSNGGFSAQGCISYSNGGAGFDCQNTFNMMFTNCIAYGNTGSGFANNSGSQGCICIGCIAEANGSYGFNQYIRSMYCATYNNASGGFQTATYAPSLGNITGSGTFFVNAAAQNFALNNTANQGLLLQAANAVFNWGASVLSTTIGYLDLGTVQHQSAGSITNIFILDD